MPFDLSRPSALSYESSAYPECSGTALNTNVFLGAPNGTFANPLSANTRIEKSLPTSSGIQNLWSRTGERVRLAQSTRERDPGTPPRRAWLARRISAVRAPSCGCGVKSLCGYQPAGTNHRYIALRVPSNQPQAHPPSGQII